MPDDRLPPPRVLIVHSFYRVPGGEDRYVRQQVELLRTRHPVELLEHRNTELEEGISTAARMTYSASERRSVGRALDRFRPDVVHLHNPYPYFGPAVHMAAGDRATPFVMTVHNLRLRCPNGLMYTEGSPCHRCEGGAYENAVLHGCFPTRSQASVYASALWVHRFVLRLEDRVDLFLAPSRFVQGRLHQWGIAPERTALVRNFTDLAFGEAGGGSGGLYLGRLAGEKGVDRLLGALRRAGDPPFTIAGDGPEAAALHAHAERLGLRRTHFTGQLERAGVEEALRQARYVVFPSVWDENAPLAALEAMAAGRPLIVTRRGGLPELVDEGGGLICEPDDESGLAAAIASLDSDADAARRAGERGQEFARATADPERHLAALEAAYRRALETPRVGQPEVRLLPATSTTVKAPDFVAIGGAARTARPARGGSLASRGAPRRVLMGHCYYRDLGGENLSFEAEVDLLRAFGHEVVSFTRDNRELNRIGPLRTVRAGLRTVWAEDTFRDIGHLIDRERPDIVHFQNTFPLISPSAIYAAHRHGVPVVMALRNYRLLCVSGVLYRDGHVCEDCLHAPLSLPGVTHGCYHDSRIQSGVVAAMQTTHRMLGTWSEAVDLFVVPTEFGRGKFIEAGLPADRIVVKPNFVSPDPGPNAGRGTTAVYAGRLAPEKGVMTLLEAWRSGLDIPLVIVGDGPLRRTMAEFVERHGLADRVRLLGHRPPGQVIEIMREARYVVFPSEWYETFGRVAAEAFACGVPVIASRLGAMGEVVADGRTGLHFTPGDAADLAAKVRWAEGHPGKVEEMSRAARAEFEHIYTAERNYDRLMEIYDLAAGRARRRAMAAER